MPDPRIAILTNVELRRLGKYLNTSLEAKGAKKEKTDDYSGHYVIASSRPPEHRPLERRTLLPIVKKAAQFLPSIAMSQLAASLR